jgi:hypothetical protein
VARKVQIMLLCDLDDGSVEAEETLQFSLGNTAYEVDVCDRHAQQLRDGLEPFMMHGREVTGTTRRPQRSGTDRQQTSGIRSWARQRGIHVNDRGRIPASVVKEYEATH